MTYNDLIVNWQQIRHEDKSFRLGQYFINMCIEDSSSDRMQTLWNETQWKIANHTICEIINEFQWDYNDLPLRKHLQI